MIEWEQPESNLLAQTLVAKTVMNCSFQRLLFPFNQEGWYKVIIYIIPSAPKVGSKQKKYVLKLCLSLDIHDWLSAESQVP